MKYLIGVGTYTAGDDAIGLRIVEVIAEAGLDREFRAIDLSSNSLNLVAYLTPEAEAILIVDSAKMGLAPGEVRFFSPADVETRKPSARISTHEGDVLRVLQLARAMGYPMPRLGIMGIEPETIEERIGLSATLEARTPGYVKAAIDELMRL
ncbi:MAG: hydrogenase maturation protease [Acidobacteria bacterium]|nr:hydrogenase maturation protease [Acidobacteriota bacterium]